MRGLLLLRFIGLYVWELLLASLVIAREVITPRLGASPGIVGVPVRGRSPLQVTMLANLISLTPGTLTIDVAPDRDVIYVHGLHVDDAERLRARVQALERRMLEALW